MRAWRRGLEAGLVCVFALALAPASAQQLPRRDVGPNVVRPPEGGGATSGWRTPPEPAPPVTPEPGATQPAAPQPAPPAGAAPSAPPASSSGGGGVPDIMREEPDRRERPRGRRARERAARERTRAEPSSREWLRQLGPFALGQLCGPRFVARGRDYLEAIAGAVQPVGPQRARLEELARSMEQAARSVQGTCTGEIAITPPGQFEAIDRRLDSVLTAVRGVRTAMDALWASLDDEQKARVNIVALQFERPQGRGGRRGRRGRRRS